MSNNFDLERAKRGEPIQFSEGSMDGKISQRWVDVHFLGVLSSGAVVVEHRGGALSTSALRMKPKSRWAVVVGDKSAAQTILNIYNNTCNVDSPEAGLLELTGDE